MSAPRIKRPFAGVSADPAQRQITSFFAAQSSDAAAAAPLEARQPALPTNVQANLLNVGMRIRKSVPEGYKTDGTSAFKLWTDSAPVSTATSRIIRTKAASRELLPFCGINKVGGLDTQPAFEEEGVPGLDAVPELTMSQESATSMSEASRKRIFDEDDEGDEDFADSPASAIPGTGGGRVMAVPRSRAKKDLSFKNRGSNGSDFEDADFLIYGEDKQMEMA